MFRLISYVATAATLSVVFFVATPAHAQYALGDLVVADDSPAATCGTDSGGASSGIGGSAGGASTQSQGSQPNNPPEAASTFVSHERRFIQKIKWQNSGLPSPNVSITFNDTFKLSYSKPSGLQTYVYASGSCGPSPYTVNSARFSRTVSSQSPSPNTTYDNTDNPSSLTETFGTGNQTDVVWKFAVYASTSVYAYAGTGTAPAKAAAKTVVLSVSSP